MIKNTKFKISMLLITGVLVSGISLKSLPMFQNINTEIKKPQESNIKESYTDDISIFAPASDEDQSLNSLPDTKSVSDNYPKNNKQEIINSNSGKANNIISEQPSASTTKDIISESKITTNDEQSFSIPPKEEKTENQTTTNTNVEVQAPTFYYDRTTKIYDDDRITLLRVEWPWRWCCCPA